MAGRKRECPHCTLQQVWLADENTFAAHFFEGTRSWCRRGKAPQEKAARKGAKRGNSVRALGGGLPGSSRR